jgi:hypothetical protein
MKFLGKDPNIIDAYYTATAEGAITAGKPVIVEADGDVAQVAAIAQAVGTPVVFESGNTSYIDSAYDSNAQKVVIAYQDIGNSGYGTAVVGTVDPSDNSISFGTPVVFESANTYWVAIAYDSNAQKVAIAYLDAGNSNYGTGIVGTVSGTSISFGSASVFESARADNITATFDSSNNKVVFSYQDDGNSGYGTSVVGTISGTSISFGTPVVFESASVEFIDSTFDSSNNKVVIVYQDEGNSSHGTAIVGTVSGTSISFGSAVVFESADTRDINVAYDSNAQKAVIAYRDVGNSQYGTAIVGTVSSTSISFGTAAVFATSASEYNGIAYDASAQKVVIAYADTGSSYHGKAVAGTVSGTSITFGSIVTYESATTYYHRPVYDANAERVVIPYTDSGNSDYGTAAVFRSASTNLTSENYIGIAADTYADNEDSTIGIVGCIDRNQTSLTAGQQYFVQTDGTLSTTAGSPSVLAGTAISATELVVKE